MTIDRVLKTPYFISRKGVRRDIYDYPELRLVFKDSYDDELQKYQMDIAQKEIDIICTKAHIDAVNENLDKLSDWCRNNGRSPSMTQYDYKDILSPLLKKHTLEVKHDHCILQHCSPHSKESIKEGLFNSLKMTSKKAGVSGLPEASFCSSYDGYFNLRTSWYSKNVSEPMYKVELRDSRETVKNAQWRYNSLNAQIDKSDAMSLLNLYDDVDGVATRIRAAHKTLTDATDAYEVIDGKYRGNEVDKLNENAHVAQEKYLKSIRAKIKQMSKDVAKLQKSFDKMETYGVYKDRVLAEREAKATEIRKAAEAKAKREREKKQQAQLEAFQTKMKEIETTRKGCGCTYTMNGVEHSKVCFESRDAAWAAARKQTQPQRPYECARRMSDGTERQSFGVWHNTSV